ncbi:beta-glucosidase, partial [Vibrio vulnificus]
DAAPLLPVTQRMVVNSPNHCELWVDVAQAGHYLCFAEMAYDREPLAQSSCSVSINGEFAMSLPTNGTEGKTVEIEGIAIHLQAGIYRIDTQFVKKGAELKTLRFEWQA